MTVWFSKKNCVARIAVRVVKRRTPRVLELEDAIFKSPLLSSFPFSFLDIYGANHDWLLRRFRPSGAQAIVFLFTSPFFCSCFSSSLAYSFLLHSLSLLLYVWVWDDVCFFGLWWVLEIVFRVTLLTMCEDFSTKKYNICWILVDKNSST